MQGGRRLNGVIRKSSSDQILVSIVTVVFNGKQHLEQTILSVIGQTYSNIEYLVIDGGSTDGTLDIIHRYSDHIDYWVSEPDKGISDAFNKGITSAQGDIIGIINADDWYEADTVDLVVRQMQDADVIYGKIRFWNDHKKEQVVAADHRGLKRQMTVHHPSVFVHRRAYEQWGLFLIEYRDAMDYDLLLRFYLKKAKFVYVNHVLSNMRRGGNSHNAWRGIIKEAKLIKERYGLPTAHILLYNNLLLFKIRTSQFIERVGLRSTYLKFKQLLTK
jgi:glycosyltransferase involved in cell wall biosynthesis